jgi:hypothetical protein
MYMKILEEGEEGNSLSEVVFSNKSQFQMSGILGM